MLGVVPHATGSCSSCWPQDPDSAGTGGRGGRRHGFVHPVLVSFIRAPLSLQEVEDFIAGRSVEGPRQNSCGLLGQAPRLIIPLDVSRALNSGFADAPTVALESIRRRRSILLPRVP